MARIVVKESTSKKTKCSCCGDYIFTGEKYSSVGSTKYCHHGNCHTHYLRLNHPEVVEDNNQEHTAEREREAYAAYQTAGCTSSYWGDRDAGYIR